MPKRGGSSGVSTVAQQAPPAPVAAAPAPPPQPQLTPQQHLAQLVQGINTLADFAALSYDDKVDLITEALKTPVPAGKPQTKFQQLAEYLGFDTTPPVVVTDAQLNAMSGPELFRTVHDVGSTSALQIAKDTLRGNDTPFYSGYNTSAYGVGLYFSTDLDGSADYGRAAYNSRTMRAKPLPSAKIVTRSVFKNELSKAEANNNRLGRLLKGMSTEDAESIFAAYKGYDIIENHPGRKDNYHTVINRGALAFSSRVRGYSSSGYNRKWGTQKSGAYVNIL